MLALNAFKHFIQTFFDFAYITLDTGTLQPVKIFKYSIEKVSFWEILVIFLHFSLLHFQFQEWRLRWIWSRMFSLEIRSIQGINDQKSVFRSITILVIFDRFFDNFKFPNYTKIIFNGMNIFWWDIYGFLRFWSISS